MTISLNQQAAKARDPGNTRESSAQENQAVQSAASRSRHDLRQDENIISRDRAVEAPTEKLSFGTHEAHLPVAIVIPARRWYFNDLSQKVEAKVLGQRIDRAVTAKAKLAGALRSDITSAAYLCDAC
ncbi:uncharacterized protein MYCFIDRAFT_176362 [Pseudocercospora fijiensis CIRAD86]|uniref:Uncharacterized protein n=1 Tax=Pseudocercospora fijiensis (strain CIRAD86) TaxID=383855 RepID=M3AV31_PSEFD|nr:uncharacterized protein MYCFIDRAFT_176362 [Pseudocercospora fijiensis CIRAD86]EME81018.1 hypothetical protein MYCFIDRAFT_176362 [Pseudocercospora fijiensis CIRAD86]